MDSINFSQISDLTLTPGTYIEMDDTKMLSGLAKPRTRALVCGQKLAAGSGAAGVHIRMLSPVHAKAVCGQGSMLAEQVISFMANYPDAEVWAIGLADVGGGTAATGTLVFTGPATAAGTLSLLVGDSRIKLPVSSGMTATQIGTAAAAAITALVDLPVTAANNTGTVTVTARHKGTAMNGYYLGYNYDQGDQLPAGVTVTATAVGGVIAGATDPDAATVFSAIGDAAFAFIVHPWTDSTNLGIMEAACKNRADAMTMNYSIAMTFKADSYANLISLGTGRNSEFSAIGGLTGSPSPAWKIGAAVAARVFWWSQNNLGCPFTDIVLAGILAPAETDVFEQTERNFLLKAGVSTLKVNANREVAIERMVTTRKTNAQGQADAGLRNLNTMLLWFYFNWAMQYEIAVTYPRYKLGDDGFDYDPDARVATPNQVKGTLAALAFRMAKAAFIQNVRDFVKTLRVVRASGDRDRLNALVRPNFINELNVLGILSQPTQG